jgi:hypothetical protein
MSVSAASKGGVLKALDDLGMHLASTIPTLAIWSLR